MAFLAAMREALSYGLTKDEFVALWDRESKLNLLIEERRSLELKLPQQNHQSNNNNHNLESRMEVLFQQCMQQVAQLDQNIQAVCALLTDIQAQQTQQQLDLHQVLTKKDFCYQLQVLDNRMTDLVNSVKSADEQSLQANFQQATQVSQSNDVSFSASSQLIDQARSRQSPSLNIDNVDDPDFGVQEMRRRREDDLVMAQKEFVREEQEWTVVGQKPWKGMKENHPQAELKAITWASVTARHVEGQSVAGTGPIAETIALQMSREMNGKQLHRSDLAKVSSSLAGKNGIMKNQVTSADPSSVTYIPKEGAVLEIPNSRLRVRNEDFFTEYFYTQPKACRVRFRLWFNKGGRLGVHLLVSEGIFDEHHQWPLFFSGTGYVYNYGSRAYSKLWEISFQECRRPEKKKEVTIGAYVCLSTSRNATENVTYDVLVSKRYEASDRLRFMWDVKATESKNVQLENPQLLDPTVMW